MKPFIFLFFFPAVFFGCREEEHPVEREKVEAIVPHLTPLRTIEPNDTLFDDLEPLTSILANKKIVLLGEQSHGDGATFLAKARLIQFLHQRLGFDVLAMESGLFDCEYAGAMIRGGFPVQQAIERSTFDIWTASKQFQPVIDYIEQTQHTGRPIRYSGFDLQITGTYGRDSLTVELQKFIAATSVRPGRGSFALALFDTLKKKPNTFRTLADSVQDLFVQSLDTLRIIAGSSRSPEKQFWLQVLRNIETLARFTWIVDWNKPDPRYLNLRDQQMGENLLWLSRVRYPGKKIIVWGASSHISRNRHEIKARKHDDTAMVPMGHRVWTEMRDSIYTLGFTAYEGRPGVRRRNAWDLAKAAAGSLEDILHHTGYTAAWLDFRNLPANHWLQETVRARPYGYATMLARWPKMMDGMLYIRTMTPSTAKE